MFSKLCLAFIGFAFLSACATGHCRKIRTTEKGSATVTEVADSKNEKKKVKVFKYDGSLQCGMGKQIPLDTMKKELGNITVYSSENKNDGLVHIQMCGSNTGKANVFEIDRDNLEKAMKLGFKEWTFDRKDGR